MADVNQASSTMDASFASLKITDQASYQGSQYLVALLPLGNHSTPLSSMGMGVIAAGPPHAEPQSHRRHSTPAALLPTQTNTSTKQGSLSIEPGGEHPRRNSSSHIHHVMEQWMQENPQQEPFNSVVYYAKKPGSM